MKAAVTVALVSVVALACQDRPVTAPRVTATLSPEGPSPSLSSPAQPVLDQSLTGPASLGAAINECCAYIGQTYTAGATGTLAGVSIEVSTWSVYPLHVAIRAASAGLPTTTTLGGVTLSSGSADLSQLIVFPQAIPQVAGGQYAIVVNYAGAPPAGPGQAQGQWAGTVGDAYAGGELVMSFDNGTSWVPATLDHSDVHFETFLFPARLTVAIDIKPGSAVNAVNPRAQGVVPVAILTTDAFDATRVDAATVRFGPTGNEATPVHSALEDVDGDGDLDMILQFNTQDMGMGCDDTSLSLSGTTDEGQPIEGSESVRPAGCTGR